ncbi:MAG: sensor histidine kinase [Nitrososphaerota archaeon]|nr:sensor histidine kinase [Nitrososphaerota archaeon]
MDGDFTDVRQHPRVLLDFFTLDGLERLTGMTRSEFVRFVVKELIDNALDKPGTRRIDVDLTSEADTTTVSVSDDGDPRLARSDLEKILDFAKAPSSKRGLKRVTRGILGNALQSCFGISYATWDSWRRPEFTAEVHGDGVYQVHLGHDGEKPISSIKVLSGESQPITKFLFRLQGGAATYTTPESDVSSIAVLNQHTSLKFTRDRKTDFLGWAEGGAEPPRAISPDVRTYTFQEFRQLLTEAKGVSAASMIREFKGLRGTVVASRVRENAGIDERADVSQLSDLQARTLFEVMRARARRTGPVALPRVGREAFARYGFTRYAQKARVFSDGEVRVPFVVEAAAVEAGSPRLFECVNFTQSLGSPFSGFVYSKQRSEDRVMRLTDLLREKRLRVMLHLVCPAIRWHNPAKGQLDIRPFYEDVARVMRSVSRVLTTARFPAADIVSAVREYMDQHLEMLFTIRQLFYQMVAKKGYPNSKSSYGHFSKALVEGRLEGEIDYERIIDMSRPEYFNDPEEEDPMKELHRRVEELTSTLNVNAWNEQPVCLEVWIEKEALSRVIFPVCQKHNVNLIVGRGYSSYTQVAKAIDRFPEGKKVRILYLGDHDPSGMHIQEKLASRFKEYARSMGKNMEIEVQRMALTFDQAKSLNLPPSKMKKLGQGSTAYRNLYSSEVWELDALEPEYLLKLVEDAILESMDKEKWKANRETLEGFKREWAERLRGALDR